jgi:hypothetical protein
MHKAGFEVLGGPDGMLDGFKSLMPDGGTVLVSEESQITGLKWTGSPANSAPAWNVASAEEYEPDKRALYRFFELFDWESVPSAGRSPDGCGKR